MRPIYALKIFGSPWPLATPTATFPEIVNGLWLRLIVLKCVQNLNFVALPVPGIIRGTQKNSAVPKYAHAPFSLKFLIAFCSDGSCERTGQI